MTEARRVDCHNPMQHNPFPLRVASCNTLRLNTTQTGSSYGRLPFAMSNSDIRVKLVAALSDSIVTQNFTPKLNSIPPLPPPALSPSRPVLRFSEGGRPEPVLDRSIQAWANPVLQWFSFAIR